MAVTVESTSTSEETSNVGTHSVTMPAGVVSGDLLIAVVAIDASEGDSAVTMTGWTSLFSTLSIDSKTSAFYKISDGTEGATDAFATTNNEQSAHAVYRISGYSGVPVVGTPATGNSPNANPSAVTPGGTADYLYIAVMGADGTASGAPTISAWPTGYTGNQTTISGTGLGSAIVAMATKATTGSTTDDPSAFTQSAGSDWVAATIAVTPATSGVAPQMYHLRYHL